MNKILINKCERINLNEFDPAYSGELFKESIKDEYSILQDKFLKLQDVFYASKKFALLVIFQGMDCSGKDGTVKKAFYKINPNGINVVSFKEPTPRELGHDYLWRVHRELPMRGNISVFNRSYYEDVLVTRVHGIIDDSTAFRRFDEINKFEEYMNNNNIIVIKFFLNISKEFQRQKLLERLTVEKKHWKFSAADLKERDFWNKYQKCYEDILSNCSTGHAPWYVVPSDKRWFRDFIVMKVIVNVLEKLDLKFPDIDENIKMLISELCK